MKESKKSIKAKRDFKTRFNTLLFIIKKGEEIDLSILPKEFIKNLETEKVI